MSELQSLIGASPSPHVTVSSDNVVSFQVQEGPIKEVGENGCQVDDIVLTVRQIIAGFNGRFPCRENEMVLTKLDEAMLWLSARKNDRLRRGVEGYNKV